jgi:hypothetical protein
VIRVGAILASLAVVLVLAGCSGREAPASATPAATSRSCPGAWAAGWQQLANGVGAPVYCPTWMPTPIDARIGGQYANGRWIDPKDRSYLVSFLWTDRDAGISREVHVNFRGYPGRTRIPRCESTLTVKGRTVRSPVPCFADANGVRRLGAIRATVYTVNQGIDQWHVVYAWKRAGSLYAVSQHVAPPYSFEQVLHNLDRITRGLVLLEPSA